jgi:hypothetical protein
MRTRDKAVPFEGFRGKRSGEAARAASGPNAVTVRAMKSADRKEGKRFRSTKELLKDLGI